MPPTVVNCTGPFTTRSDDQPTIIGIGAADQEIRLVGVDEVRGTDEFPFRANPADIGKGQLPVLHLGDDQLSAVYVADVTDWGVGMAVAEEVAGSLKLPFGAKPADLGELRRAVDIFSDKDRTGIDIAGIAEHEPLMPVVQKIARPVELPFGTKAADLRVGMVNASAIAARASSGNKSLPTLSSAELGNTLNAFPRDDCEFRQ